MKWVVVHVAAIDAIDPALDVEAAAVDDARSARVSPARVA
jgi:hypothetical protein